MKRIIAAFAIAIIVCGSAAWAVPPEQYPVGPIQENGPVVADCGDFLVLNDFRMEGFQRDYFNSDGSLKSSLTNVHYLDSIYYNSNDPSYWLAGTAEHLQQWAHYQDGVVVSYALTGPGYKVTVPGYGAVFIDTGLLVYDPMLGEITHLAGKHDSVNG